MSTVPPVLRAFLYKVIATVAGTLILAFYVHVQFKKNQLIKFQPPSVLRFYAKPNVSLMERIAGYKAAQEENEEFCRLDGPRQECSFPLLNEYHQQCDFFSTKTAWKNVEVGYPKAKIISDTCIIPSLETEVIPDLQNYVDEANLTHMVLFGDSQGRRYFLALKSIFLAAGFECEVVKFELEGFTFGLAYFVDDVPADELLPVNRTCQSCSSARLNCTNDYGRTLYVEYISMLMNSKSTMRASDDFCKKYPMHNLCTSTSQQEYVFKHYFNKGKYPELMLMFTTFAHDRERLFTDVEEGMNHVVDVIDRNLPPTSTVVWYDTTPFHENHMYHDLRDMICENGYHVNQKIDVLNHLLFHILKPLLKPRKGKAPMYAFFDMYHLQEDLKHEWSLDFVHSKPPWYQYIIASTFRMLAKLL